MVLGLKTSIIVQIQFSENNGISFVIYQYLFRGCNSSTVWDRELTYKISNLDMSYISKSYFIHKGRISKRNGEKKVLELSMDFFRFRHLKLLFQMITNTHAHPSRHAHTHACPTTLPAIRNWCIGRPWWKLVLF